jgi:hypothetical protein
MGLSDGGTIPQALKSIYNQAQTIVVVVRVGGADTEEIITNAAGDVASYTGVYSLMQAESLTTYKPKLLLCPYLTGILTEESKPNNVVASLRDVAERLRAVAILDGTNTNRTDVIAFAGNIGDSRVQIIDPSYKPNFIVDNVDAETLSSSPVLAGVFAQNDATKGY